MIFSYKDQPLRLSINIGMIKDTYSLIMIGITMFLVWYIFDRD